MTDTAKVSIARPREWFGRFRKLLCLIDDRVVARLKIGEAASCELEPGRHVVQVKMDWCSSPPVHVEVDAGESLAFVVESPSAWKSLRRMRFRPDSFFELLPVELPCPSAQQTSR